MDQGLIHWYCSRHTFWTVRSLDLVDLVTSLIRLDFHLVRLTLETVELEYETLRERSYRTQPSELADQHYKDSLAASADSPFAIAARFMIENIFSHEYSHFPGSELGMDQLIGQVNSGGVGTVRRLELELMQAGKVRRHRATFLFPKKAHMYAWGG
jgi:hypothetical protein